MTMSEEKSILRLREEINASKTECDKLKGQIKGINEVLAEAKKRVGKNSKAKLATMRKQIRQKEEALVAMIEKFRADYDFD